MKGATWIPIQAAAAWRHKLIKRAPYEWVFLNAEGTPFYWAVFKCKGDASRALKAWDAAMHNAVKIGERAHA